MGPSLTAALSYPRETEGWRRRVGIGGLLVFAGLLTAVPMLAVLGYLASVSRTTVDGSGELPAFGDWTRLFLDGLRLTAVAICYVLPTFVAVGGAYLATFGFVLASYGSAEVLALLVALAFQAAFLFALCWWLGVFVVLPAAFVRVSRLRSLRTGLHVRRVLGLVARRRYLGAWLLGTILSLTVGSVLLLSSYVLVGAFPMFYLLVALIRYISQTHPESGSAGRRVDEPISGGVDPPT